MSRDLTAALQATFEVGEGQDQDATPYALPYE